MAMGDRCYLYGGDICLFTIWNGILGVCIETMG